MSEANITPVLMPKWGLSMSEGVLVDWLVDEGAEINVGDEIMEVETDKIASAVEATDPGVLRRRVGQWTRTTTKARRRPTNLPKPPWDACVMLAAATTDRHWC